MTRPLRVPKRAPLSPLLMVLGAVVWQQGCQQRTYNAATRSSAGSPPAQCTAQKSVKIADYAGIKLNCYQPKGGYLGLGNKYDAKKDLAPWVPGNAITFYSHASTDAGFDYEKAFEAIAKKNYFEPDLAKTLVAHALSGADNTHPTLADHPALNSPLHKGLLDVIHGAKKTLFLDIMLFGGAWGTEIVREMMKVRKNNPGLEIVFLRDNVNVFGFSTELDPLWNALVEFDEKNSDLKGLGAVVALNADIDTKLPKGLPAKMGEFTSKFAYNAWVKDFVANKLPRLHLAGKSDHSKIVIADAFTPQPAMWVASKNPTDNNLLNFDEGVVVKGPAAALAQMAFGPDLRLAAKQTEQGGRYENKTTARGRTVVANWLREMERLADPSQNAVACAPPPPAGEPAQNVDIRIAENNGDDSVRNVEHTVLQLIRSAKKNVRMYNMLAYNPAMAEAYADAIARLGSENVKMIIDQALTFTPNLIFHEMVGAARVWINQTTTDSEQRNRLNSWDNSFRWRVGLKAKHFEAPAEKGAYKRIDIDQQQHSKTIIIDDEILFVGSANFDLITFGGSFREFSVAARTKETDVKARQEVAKAVQVFERIWNNPNEVKTTEGIRAERAKDVPANAVIKLAAGMLTGEHRVREGLMPSNVPADGECR